jgi:hypothetical protein
MHRLGDLLSLLQVRMNKLERILQMVWLTLGDIVHIL